LTSYPRIKKPEADQRDFILFAHTAQLSAAPPAARPWGRTCLKKLAEIPIENWPKTRESPTSISCYPLMAWEERAVGGQALGGFGANPNRGAPWVSPGASPSEEAREFGCHERKGTRSKMRATLDAFSKRHEAREFGHERKGRNKKGQEGESCGWL
jgi:hypothetical protein